ncbi:MAG: hypothetical protein V4667_07325 [Bacteroidota bacterium]
MRKNINIVYVLLLTLVISVKAQVQVVSTGTGAAYTLTYPGVVTLTPGISITFKANVVNTGAATINVNTTGAVAINKNSNQALVVGDIAADQFVTLIYDGAKFQMVTPSSAPGGFANTSLSNLTSTSINESLIPNTNNARSLGSNTIAWADTWLEGKLYIAGAPWTSLAANNTLIGTKGGEAFTTGLYNLGVGQGSGTGITTGYRNTAVGHRAGELLTTQSDNTFVGNLAGGLTSIVGDNNTFLGSYAGYSGSNTGSTNTFLGYNVGSSNTSGSNNTYVGGYSAYSATSGNFNTVVGNDAGQNLTTGGNNTFVGYNTGFTTATQRTNATAIGYNTTVDADNAVVLGNNANVGIGITTPGKFAGSTRYLSVAAITTGVSNGTASLELIGNTASYNTLASKIDFLGIVPISNIASQRARIEALSGASITSAGQLAFSTNNGTNASSIFERMRITEAGRVGIGTTAPSTASLFSVGASSQFQVSSIGDIVRINNVPTTWPTTNTAGFLQNDGTGALAWGALPSGSNAWTKTGTSIYQTVLTDLVGIGTSSPGYKLHVSDNSANPAVFTRQDGAGNAIQGNAYGTGDGVYGGASGGGFGVRARTTSTGAALLAEVQGGGTGPAAIFSGGAVGIGTSLPTFDLSFRGNAASDIGMVRNTVAATAGNILRIEAGGATLASTDRNGGALNLAAGLSTGTGTSTINFLTSTPSTLTGATDNLQSTKMTITGDGDVGIGATPNVKFHVNDASGTVTAVRFQIAGTTKFRLDNNGGVSIGSNVVPPANGLNLGGDAIVPAANDYTYAAAKTKTVTIPAIAFNNVNAAITYDANGARIFYNGATPVYAPLILPIGAIITGVRWIIFDNTVGQSNTGGLYRLAEGSTTSTLISSTISVDNGAVNNHAAVPNHTVLVNNAYTLKWTPTDNSQSLYMCTITYTVLQAE